MKTIFIIIFITLVFASLSNAQSINWSALHQDQKHIVNLNVGWDYATTMGLGYGYILKTKIPAVFNAQVSIPAGSTLLDDFKTKAGIQVCAYKNGNFLASAMVYGIFRRYESNVATLHNFGSELTGVAGYYKKRWFVAGEFGFDKAIATHIKSNRMNSEYYPPAQDGWYVATGGNFHYGIQTGYSIKNFDITLRGGKIADQNFESTALAPFYLQVGVNSRL